MAGGAALPYYITTSERRGEEDPGIAQYERIAGVDRRWRAGARLPDGCPGARRAGQGQGHERERESNWVIAVARPAKAKACAAGFEEGPHDGRVGGRRKRDQNGRDGESHEFVH